MPTLKAAIVQVTPFQQNCTLLWDEESGAAAVIDPGGDVARILAAIDKYAAAVPGWHIERIVLTHGHLDHAGGAAEMKETLAARGSAVPVEGPDQRDKFLLDGIAQQAAEYGIPGLRSVTPDRWLSEGETLRLAGVDFGVLHCPGHTPGHLVFVNVAARLALVGDVLFQGSVGRTDFPYGDTEALLRSIRDKLLPLPDDVSFICGHGNPSTIGAERRSNPFLRAGAV